MSIFGSIAEKIFGHHSTTAGQAAAPTAAPGKPAAPTAAPGKVATPTAAQGAAPRAPTATASTGTPGAAPTPLTRDQVNDMIGKLAATSREKFNWQQSIVDLMKLLNLDSSLAARKQLAQELGYKGELNGSAEMNIWLHQQVMTKLAESGGVVPESLKHA
jgi:hypothetical protein